MPIPKVAVTADSVQPVEARGIHNLFRVSDRIYSGSTPEGEVAFASLQKLGVRTIVSVDGATPDVDAAKKYGFTYVHIPFGYDGIPRDKIFALAKVAGTLPTPIYVHCHHGIHRGPAAVAVMQVCTDHGWNAEQSEAWYKAAGTDPKYTGLYSLPRSLIRPTAEELARMPAVFPSVASVSDLAHIMVEVDARWDNLKTVKTAGWTVSKDHPDIDPPHEALQLVELYREASRLESVKQKGPAFVKLFGESEAAAEELEKALRTKPTDSEQVSMAFSRSARVCTTCHGRFRDRPENRQP